MSKKIKYDVIISHASCPDGSTAAAIAYNYLDGRIINEGMYGLKKQYGTDVHTCSGALKLLERYPDMVPVIFMHHGEIIDVNLIKNKKILVLDLDIGRSNLELLDTHCTSCTVLDHHEDSQMTTLQKYFPTLTPEMLQNGINLTLLSGKIEIIVRTSKEYSGATLSWLLFYPHIKIPIFVDAVCIRDTWDWDNHHNYDVRSFIEGLEFASAFDTFKSISMYINSCTLDSKVYETIIGNGKITWGLKSKLIDSNAHKATLGYIKACPEGVERTYTILYTNAVTFTSDIGDRLRKVNEAVWNKRNIFIDFTVVWKYIPPTFKREGIVVVSLRSPSPGIKLGLVANTIIGTTICKGNGHSEAASFSFYNLDNFHKVFLVSP
jgi:hypothetical protein